MKLIINGEKCFDVILLYLYNWIPVIILPISQFVNLWPEGFEGVIMLVVDKYIIIKIDYRLVGDVILILIVYIYFDEIREFLLNLFLYLCFFFRC